MDTDKLLETAEVDAVCAIKTIFDDDPNSFLF
jgi:hypothetical protein